MASHHSVRRGRVRRLAALSTLVFVSVGMLALEHTATGATTGQPSHYTTTTKHTTTTKYVTTTTSKHGGDSGDPRHCEDGHGRDNEKNKHCRPPSGGPNDH